jgi:hypothetical protein
MNKNKALSRDFAKWQLEQTFASHPVLTPKVFEGPIGDTAMTGKQMVALAELGYLPGLTGADVGGYQTQGDIVQATADGIDLNALWDEFQQVLDLYNEQRAALVGLMTFPVTQLIETVPQGSEASFEMASEFGEPKAIKGVVSYFQLAYDFKDYDLATRYTWKYLRDADARQVEALHKQALGADSRLIFRKVMEALFVNSNRDADVNAQNYTVFSLYNGTDGAVPPKYKDITFTSAHSHYITSGATLVDSDDIEDMYEHIAHHGYGIEQGTTFVLLCNRDEIRTIRTFRAGVANGTSTTDNEGNALGEARGIVAGQAVATFDFIPAEGQPTMIVPNQQGLIGSGRPQSTWNGLPVIGSYGGILIVEEGYIPSGYMVMLGSGGAGDLQNPVGLREHANPAYRGLRLLPGNQQRYPLIDSYYARAFGTGVRQRGGAVVMQITTGTTYTSPPQYSNTGVLT